MLNVLRYPRQDCLFASTASNIREACPVRM